MCVWTNLRELKLWKNKFYIALFIIELLIVVWSIYGLFGKNRVYEYGVENATVYFGEYSETEGGYRVDANAGMTGNMLEFGTGLLPEGHYIVSLQYATDTEYSNMCTINADTAGYKGCLTNGSSLYAALDETDFEMWLLRDVPDLKVQANYNSGTLLVKGLTITETNALNRVYLSVAIMIISVLNGVICFREYDKKNPISQKTKIVIFGLGLITIFSSIPVLTDYFLYSGDGVYHLNRIEGLKDGILSGQFPVRIAPRWLNDNGYASAVFYCEIMLLPAALLRMIGFTVTASYQIYIFFINLLTAVVAYSCFKKMFKDEYVGLLCSMLYTLSVYRIFKTYIRGSLGETMAMVFLPLIVYGFYKIFTEDVTQKKYKWCFIPLTIGFSGLIQTHWLTCELVGGFTILLCLVLWKKVFRQKTFWALAKTVIWSVLICSWFLIPFLDYMITGDFVIQNVSARTIQDRGIYIAHLFMTTPFYGNNSMFADSGMLDTAPTGVGFALVVVLIIWLYLWFTRNKKELQNGYLKKQEIVLGKIVALFAVLAMIMSLNLFPWDWIQAKHSILATLVSSLQFPTRLLTIASILLVVLSGVVYKYVIASGKELWKSIFVLSMCGLTIITGLFTISDIMHKHNAVRIYNAAGMGYGYISGAEYLPYGTDQDKLTYRNPESLDSVVITAYEKDLLQVDVSCYNSESAEGTITMPFLYYKGYEAYDMSTGEELEVFDGDNHSVGVKIPADYSGTIRTHFVSPWYWRLAELITILAVAALVIFYQRDRKKGKLA